MNFHSENQAEVNSTLKMIQLFIPQRVQAWTVFPVSIWGRICFRFSRVPKQRTESAILNFPSWQKEPGVLATSNI